MNKFVKKLWFTLVVLVGSILVVPLLIFLFGTDNLKTSMQIIFNSLIGYGVASPSEEIISQRLVTPVGYSINRYASDLGKIRFMVLAKNGDLIVSRPRENDVLLLKRDANGDGEADGQEVLLSDLTLPHGLAIDDKWLYVAESTGVGRVPFDSNTATVTGDYQRIIDDLDGGGNHWTKTISIGPDNWIYLAQGSSCNVCEESDPRRATVMRFKKDGSEQTIFATGLRNSVGMDWSPWRDELYATDNGRDLLGDDYPPCELNKIVDGGFYGWPYINGSGDLDPDMGEGKEDLVHNSIWPVHLFRAHNAPLGMRFLRNSPNPDYNKTALVALHGSWNRSVRDGYKVVALRWQDDGSIIERDFVSGFEQNDNVIGRPVDIVEDEDGAIYISDDYSGTIYRVVYQGADNGVMLSFEQESQLEENSALIQQALAVYESGELAELNTQGETIYQQYQCAGCHNPAMARPNRTIVELDKLYLRYSIAELMSYFTAPTPPMPLYPLDEKEREALAVYLYGAEL